MNELFEYKINLTFHVHGDEEWAHKVARLAIERIETPNSISAVTVVVGDCQITHRPDLEAMRIRYVA